MGTSITTRIGSLGILVTTLAFTGCLSESNGVANTPGPTPPPPSSNGPPTISGSPDNAVMVGNSYLFTPTATDPEGDTLTFSVRNLPTWASFDTASGEVNGQPLLGDIGTYDTIDISVSDGTNSASLPSFSITVSQAALGSMLLSWTPPSQNTDGTALTDLTGYKLYYGIEQGSYPNQIDIDNPSVTSYIVDNLLPDTYYVVSTSVNSVGIESTFSNVTVRTVGGT